MERRADKNWRALRQLDVGKSTVDLRMQVSSQDPFKFKMFWFVQFYAWNITGCLTRLAVALASDKKRSKSKLSHCWSKDLQRKWQSPNRQSSTLGWLIVVENGKWMNYEYGWRISDKSSHIIACVDDVSEFDWFIDDYWDWWILWIGGSSALEEAWGVSCIVEMKAVRWR